MVAGERTLHQGSPKSFFQLDTGSFGGTCTNRPIGTNGRRRPDTGSTCVFTCGGMKEAIQTNNGETNDEDTEEGATDNSNKTEDENRRDGRN